MKTHYGFDEQYLEGLQKRLNIALANTFVLYVQTLNGHWNLEDPKFLFMHEMLQKQYEGIAANIDLLAERIRTLGKTPLSNMQSFLSHATMEEQEPMNEAKEILHNLSECHEMAMRELRAIIEFCDEHGDVGTSDLLTEILRDHEKTAWMLRSHL